MESKRQSRLSTEALSGAPEQSGAEDWLSSPEVDLGAIQASWDSVLQQENVLVRERGSSRGVAGMQESLQKQ